MAGWSATALVVLLVAPLAWSVRRFGRAFGAQVGLASAAAMGGLGSGVAIVLAPTAAWLVASTVLLWPLAALALIDLRVQRLPDALTLPLLLAGLLQALVMAPAVVTERAVGAIVGYALLALIAWVYRKSRGREGLGLGDAKLLAAGGAWLGWAALPAVLLAASVAGLAWAAVLALRGRAVTVATPIAFGAPLAAAIWLTWLWAMAAPIDVGG